MKPGGILQSDPSAGLVHRVELQGVFRFHGDKDPEISSSVTSGRSISITPTIGVDSNGKASEEGWIGMLKRCTRATMLGGPLKNAKCGGGLRFGTHCVFYDGIGSGSERVLACVGRKRAIHDPEPGTFDFDFRARAGWFLGVAQQKSRSVNVLGLHERRRGWHCRVLEVSAASPHAQLPNDEAMIMRVPAIWVRWRLVRPGTL